MFIDFETFFIMVEFGLTVYIYSMFVLMFMGMILETVFTIGGSRKPLLNNIDINKKYTSEEELLRDLGALFDK
jgi:hypothetical protein